MNKTKIKKVVVNINKFYASSLSVIFFTTLTFIFGLVQIILFLTNSMKLNGNFFTDVKGSIQEIYVWLAFAVSITSSFTGFIGGILSLRENPNFIVWCLIQLFCTIIITWLAGMILTMVATIIALILSIIRFLIWRFWPLNYSKLNYKNIYIGIIFSFICLLIIFISLEINFSDLHKFTNGDIKPIWTGIFDALSSSMNIIANILFTFKIKWTFVMFLISKVFLISNYTYTGNIIPIIQVLLFAIMDVTGFLAWLIHIDKIKIPDNEI